MKNILITGLALLTLTLASSGEDVTVEYDTYAKEILFSYVGKEMPKGKSSEYIVWIAQARVFISPKEELVYHLVEIKSKLGLCRIDRAITLNGDELKVEFAGSQISFPSSSDTYTKIYFSIDELLLDETTYYRFYTNIGYVDTKISKHEKDGLLDKIAESPLVSIVRQSR